MPLHEDENPRFDLANIGFAGTLKNSLKEVLGESPHFGSISQHVLQKGTLVVENIDDPKNSFNRQLKIPDHHFIKKEGVRALIGIAIRVGVDEKPLGLLYLDYRQPQKFSDLEKLQGISFASLAGMAISNARRMDEFRRQKQNRLKIFLCHSKQDKDRVQLLYDELKKQPDIEPWLDDFNLLPGVDWDQEIEKAVRNSDAVLVCLSEKALTRDGYVHKELRIALDTAERKPDGTIYIIPLRLEDCRVPDRLSRWQWVDYFTDSQHGLDRLMKSLRIRAATLTSKRETGI